MRLTLAAVTLIVGLFSMPLVAFAGLPEPCTRLSAEKLAVAKSAMSKVHPHDCCDDTLLNCAQQATQSRLVFRLAWAVCTRVAAGDGEKEIVKELEKRASSMLASKVTIDTQGLAWAGEAGSPVQLVVYACARCPFCAKSVAEVYEAVTSGNLKGKARFAMKLYPVKSHEGSKEGGFAFEAARSLGKFWSYVLTAYKRFDSFSVAKLADWAEEVGMSRSDFSAAMGSAATRDMVVASKKEGIRNQVESTPTYFINGKLYQADLKTWAISCAVMEEWDRMNGNLCKP